MFGTACVSLDLVCCVIGICSSNGAASRRAYRHARTVRPYPYSNRRAYGYARNTRPYPCPN